VHASAVVFTMDTPGGLLSSLKTIKDDFLREERIPIVVYIAPPGARAASAGAYITMASDVAAMAPQTNIGAATPVDGSGGNVGSDLRRKLIQDTSASMRTLATSHGRDVKFAQEAVTKAISITDQEALQRHVVEFRAKSLDDLLAQIDGFRTKPKGSPCTPRTRASSIRRLAGISSCSSTSSIPTYCSCCSPRGSWAWRSRSPTPACSRPA